MRRRMLPRIAALSGAEAARARHVVVHSPVHAGPDALTWMLTLVAEDGDPLAESRTTSPNFPLPLGDIAQVHLDVVGLVTADGWTEQQTRDGGPRFQARVRPARQRD